MSEKKSTDQSASYHGEEARSLRPEENMPIRAEPEAKNRGRRAVREGSGVVSGSGAGAGGGSGIDEDYDDDPVGGGGPMVMPTPEKSE
jgi:hypothetical protein